MIERKYVHEAKIGTIIQQMTNEKEMNKKSI